MPTIKEVLDGANTVYKTSLDLKALKGALQAATLAFKSADISEQNREVADFLIIKLNVKIYAMEYFCNGYEADSYAILQRYIIDTLKSCNPSYVKTIELMKSVSCAAESINSIAVEAHKLQALVRDCEGRCVANGAEECLDVANQLKVKIAAAQNLKIAPSIFCGNAAFPDVKKQFVADLCEIVEFAERNADELNVQAAENLIKTGIENVTSKLNKENYEYKPSIINAERLARTIVLCTPFSEEAELFAYARSNGADIYTMQALAFENLPESVIKSVFKDLKARKADCVIYGALHFRAANRSAFYRAVIDFCSEGRKAYIVTDDGTQKVYEAVLEAIKTDTEYSPLDVSLFYLSMPDFLPTVEELKGLGMISDSADDMQWVQKNMPFVGFVGLNVAVKAFRAGADWRKIASERSADNYALAEKYMLNLVRQALFIDGGWGNYHEDVIVNKTKKFDYDDIRLVNPDNIRKIMQGNYTLFQKCGMISTYCLLGGASADDWRTFPIEIKSERLTEACKLVLRALDVDIIPVVEVKEDIGVKGAGGLCCDGGKKILYRESAVASFDWIAKAVCHECFHAFQQKAINSSWQEWYATELHITPGRVEQWRYNYSRYRSIDKGYEVYMIQIYESDARAFEDDCLGKDINRGQILNLINLD